MYSKIITHIVFNIKRKVFFEKGKRMLRLERIKKDYLTAAEPVHALKGVSIAFRKSEFVSILGPSGCGKTTLLNIIGGLDHYTSGDLVINGTSTKRFKDRDWDVYRNHRIGFIFQSYNLIPHQTVLGNVELALTIAGISKEERIARAKQALDRVGLANQYNKKPNQLSGGQCQRVAIARALVNDPEILLADEPTGALDTVTSVQIMDLIKEISKERLVIMVTHNPELADKYSTRIIRLLDGEVVEDSNPLSPQAEMLELKTEKENEIKRRRQQIRLAKETGDKKKLKELKKKGKGKAKAKMSLLTTFRLSFKNLLSKRARTLMVGFAGSIGIIGIAMVLAFSAGIKGYIASMQDDMLSGNPIEISENAYDIATLTDMMENALGGDENLKDKIDAVYISSLVEYFAKMNKDMSSLMLENEITEDYIEYIKQMPEGHYNAILFNYGIDLVPSIYTDFKLSVDGEAKHYSTKLITDIYISILEDTIEGNYASQITTLVPSFKQAPNNKDYLLSQYNLVGENSRFPENKNEIMLVLNSEDELSDLLLARLGYYTQDEFLEIINKATSEDGAYDESLYREYFTYDELLDKTLVYYPADTVFSESAYSPYKYQYNSSLDINDIEANEGVELKVVGILTPKDSISYGSLRSGVYYTEELTEYVLKTNAESSFVSYLNSEEGENNTFLKQTYFNIPYMYTYVGYDGEEKNGTGVVGASAGMSAIIGSLTGNETSVSDMRDGLVRVVGGNSLASEVNIYPVSFDEKNYVTDYLKAWNGEEDIQLGDKLLTAEDRNDIEYTDTLELVISMLNTLIDIVSYALIAFTSISLVVSTVMIGIITYVSVVERIKEIGVIRALGGRKRDVSNLFVAETFIIGSLSGIFGVSFTYLASFIANMILEPLINYDSIASLPIDNAIILIALSIILTLVSGVFPARSAAKKDPVVALRTE